MPKSPKLSKPSKINNLFNRPSFRRSGMFFHSPLQKTIQQQRRSTLGQPDVAVETALRQQLTEVFSPQSLLKVEVLEPEYDQSNESTPLIFHLEEQDQQNNNNIYQQQQIPPSILVSSSSIEKSVSTQELAGISNLANNNNININKKHHSSHSKVFPNTTSTQTVRTIVLRRPTITIQEDGRILIGLYFVIIYL